MNEVNIIYGNNLQVVDVRMSIIKGEGNVTDDNKIRVKWFEGKDKIIDCYEFVFRVLGMEEAIIKASTIFTLNKQYISRISIENSRYS